ncbi:MAG: acyltransferase, partial [Aquihabitans sp.]
MSVGLDDRPAPRAATTPCDAIGGYQPGLDGMRGAAMALVVAYHAQLGRVKGGFLGVSVFFTLSGFLITGLLLRSHDRGGIQLKTFWTNRFRRLMPAALVGLVLVVVFGATVATKQQADSLPGQAAAAAGYMANWFFIMTDQSYVNLFAAPSPVQHYWSLAVEEQFYLLMPLGFLLLLKRTRSWVVLASVFGGSALLSTLWMVRLYGDGSGLDRVYYGTDTRMAEVLTGSLLAVILTRTGRDIPAGARRAIGVIGLVAAVAALLLAMTVPYAPGPIWRGGMLGFSLLSCAIILAIVTRSGPVNLILSWGPFAVLGRLSYGVYLYHWPIFLWLTEARTGLSVWPLLALRVGVTGVTA